MKVSDIIYQVRESLDEQSGTTDFVDTYLDNIIKAKVYDALRWVLMYADVSLINDSSSTGSSGNIIQNDNITVDSNGYITLDSKFVRLIRVRVDGWYKAVRNLVEEDSEEYLMQSDDTAKADNSRPVAALIRTVPNKIQVFPKPETSKTTSITYVVMDSTSDTSTLSGDSTINVPQKLITAYIYYICYLVMIAHDDTSKASNMLATAKMNAGINDNK